MIITALLTVIALFGTLTIVAYLRQVEEGMAELQEELETPLCPVCLEHHQHQHHDKKMHRSLGGIKNYYKRKKARQAA